MKKHDEGYILAYVTVVLLVFCLVATTILTGALQNLQNQQNANEKMKQQYIAAGELEKVIAQWKWEEWPLSTDPDNPQYIPGTTVQCLGRSSDEVTLYVEEGTVSITCRIRIADKGYNFYEVGGVDE